MKEELIRAAKAACEHVYQVCPLGSANRPNGQSQELALQALMQAKYSFDDQIEEIIADPTFTEAQKNLTIIRLLADIGHGAKAGNCQEMAAIAFLFLIEKEIFPIELVHTQEHTFIVIGRNPDTSSINDIKDWTKDVVICDPWRRTNSTQSEMGLFYHQESMCFPPERLLELLSAQMDDLAVGFSINENPFQLFRAQASTPS